MLSKSLKESAHLFGSLDALHHGRVLLLSTTLCLVVLVFWLSAGLLWTHKGWEPLVLLLCVLSAITLIWGGNAVGIMTMDEVALRPPRPLSVLWRQALSASQQLVMVLMTLILFSLLTLLTLALLLLICRLPILGPWFFALVLPLATVIAGIAFFVFPFFVLALSAPAIWCGVDASTSLAQTWSVARQRLSTVSACLLVLAVITMTACLLLLGFSTLGLWLVNVMSSSILGIPGAWPTGLFLFNFPDDAALSNYANAANVGLTATSALVCNVAGLVAIRGACLVYQHVLRGLDTQPEQQFVQAALEGTKKNWRELQTRPALKPAGGHAEVSAVPLHLSSAEPASSPPPTESIFQLGSAGIQSQQVPAVPIDIDLEAPKQIDPEKTRTCPTCGSSVLWTDFFCGECGQPLR